MRQNDAFLPFTINTATPDVPALPATSLDGRKQTLAMNYTLTSRAIPAVPLTFRYRSYDYNNDSSTLRFSKYVSTDSSSLTPAAGVERQSLPYAYDRKTLGLDAATEFFENSWVAFLYEWERFDREHRDLEESTQNTLGVRFDLSPRDWLLLRTSYKHSDRGAEHYEANEESFPLGEGTALGQLHELRKFDEAARKRHRVEALLQITPVDQFSFGASYGTTQDDYEESHYGLQKDINFNYTFELTYDPHPAVSLFGEYTREKYKYRQRSRRRQTGNDTAGNDWESNRRDVVDTWSAGLDSSLSDKVIFNAFYSLSAAKNSILTRALGIPSPPGYLALAQDYPDTSNRWHQVVASVKFPVSGGLTPKFEYRYEKYDRVDFQLENAAEYLSLDPGLSTGIFLGVGTDIPGYDAHIVSASLEYRF
jgi:MtrB/PioB family decaheme-associated outer membrane protein